MMLRYICVSFAILASSLVAGATKEEMGNLEKYITESTQKCYEQFKVTKEDLLKPRSADSIEKVQPCLFACVMKEKGVLDDKGMFDPKPANSIAEKFFKSPEDLKIINKIGEDCLSVNEEQVSDGAEGCERAMLIMQCFIDNKASQVLI